MSTAEHRPKGGVQDVGSRNLEGVEREQVEDSDLQFSVGSRGLLVYDYLSRGEGSTRFRERGGGGGVAVDFRKLGSETVDFVFQLGTHQSSVLSSQISLVFQNVDLFFESIFLASRGGASDCAVPSFVDDVRYYVSRWRTEE